MRRINRVYHWDSLENTSELIAAEVLALLKRHNFRVYYTVHEYSVYLVVQWKRQAWRPTIRLSDHRPSTFCHKWVDTRVHKDPWRIFNIIRKAVFNPPKEFTRMLFQLKELKKRRLAASRPQYNYMLATARPYHSF